MAQECNGDSQRSDIRSIPPLTPLSPLNSTCPWPEATERVASDVELASLHPGDTEAFPPVSSNGEEDAHIITDSPPLCPQNDEDSAQRSVATGPASLPSSPSPSHAIAGPTAYLGSPWSRSQDSVASLVRGTSQDQRPHLSNTPAASSSHDRDSPTAAPGPSLGNPGSYGKPASISSQQKRRILLYATQYHLPAISMTVLITILYAREVIWPFPAAPTTSTSQAGIQTLAQLHGALIVLSLSQILLHRVRRLLLQGEGVEIGFVYANYRLGSPIYCLSDEFLGAARHCFRDSRTLRTVSLTLLALIITLVLTPLSAILLTPQPGTSALGASHPIIKSLPDGYELRPSGFVEVELPVPEKDLWAKSLGPSLGVTWSCQSHNMTARSCSHIPSWFQTEYEDILLSVSYRAHQKHAGSSFGVSPSHEKSRPLSESISGGKLRYTYNKDLEDYYSGAVTCPLWVAAGIGTALNKVTLGRLTRHAFETNTSLPTPNGDIFEVSWDRDIRPRQPLVFMQSCSLLLFDTANQGLVDTLVSWRPSFVPSGCFSQGLYPAFVPHFTEATAKALAKGNWEESYFTFIDMQDSLPYPVSTAAIRGESVPDHSTGGRVYYLEIYTFVGIWAEAEPSFTNESTFSLQENLDAFFRPGALLQPLDTYSNSTIDAADVVSIDAKWINSLLTYKPFKTSNMSTASLLASDDLRLRLPLIIASTMAAAPCSLGICEPKCQPFGGCEPGSILQMFYWNDFITYNYTQKLTPSEANLTENQTTLRIKFKASYTAYRFSTSWLVILGFVILYIHVALVLAHFAIIAFGDWWTSNAWSNLGDFLVLAMRSSAARSATLLARLSSDNPDSRTWGLVVRMCNTHDGDETTSELEMVLEDAHGVFAAEVPE